MGGSSTQFPRYDSSFFDRVRQTAPLNLVVSEKVVLQNFDYAVAVSDYWRSPCFLMYGFARTGFQRGSVLLTAHRVLNADFARVVRYRT